MSKLILISNFNNVRAVRFPQKWSEQITCIYQQWRSRITLRISESFISLLLLLLAMNFVLEKADRSYWSYEFTIVIWLYWFVSESNNYVALKLCVFSIVSVQLILDTIANTIAQKIVFIEYLILCLYFRLSQ